MSSSARKSIDSFSSPLSSPLSPSHSTEYPFPRYESSQRPSSSGRYQPRRGSAAGSISSIGGALDTSAGSWPEPLREAGQNAISTLLQPPIVRTGLLPHTSAPASSAHRQPTTKDIPPVALTNITHVESSQFNPYLTQVGALYDALQRVKDDEDEATGLILRRGSKVDDLQDLLDKGSKDGKRPSASRQASLASLALLSPTTGSPPRRRSSGGTGRRSANVPTPLSTIPSVYFEDDFHLENPRTFDVVSERSEVVRPVPRTPDKAANGNSVGPRKALATNAILQEKLSWYMDTIEVHLISSISTASTSFFAALGSLRELHSEAADSVSRIKSLRSELSSLDEKIALGGLNIVEKRQRRQNLDQLKDTVRQLKRVVDGVTRCESLVDNGDIEQALDAADALEKLINGEQSEIDAKTLNSTRMTRLRNLNDAPALQGVAADLSILRYRVGKAFEAKFIGGLLGDLRSHIGGVPLDSILQRWSNASNRSRGGHNRDPSVVPSYLTLEDQFRSDLFSCLKGLHRAQHTTPAAAAYRDAVLRETKTIIKRPLPSSNDDDNESVMSASTAGTRQPSQQDRSSILARNLRALDAGAAEDMLIKIYVGVGEALRRLGTQVKIILDVTSNLDDPSGGSGAKSPPRSPNFPALDGRMSANTMETKLSSRQMQEELHQALDMSNLLGQAVDIAQNQIVKVLRVRNEQSVQQTPTRFLRYFTINLLFANECEAVSGRGGTALKNLVNSQIREFIRKMGDAEQQKLAKGMNNDLWNPKDFNENDTAVLSRVLDGSTRDAEAWTIGGKVWLPYDESSADPPPVNGQPASTNGAGARDKVRPASIDSESFILPISAMLCLHGLQPFLELITGIPSLTSEISACLISFLQQFNSSCTQLILGAGATRSVGLKNITAKHLALASQALSFIATLIPHIREFVRRHAGSGAAVGSLMGEFDKVRRLFQEHQNSISEKLVEIMAGRATTHVKSMKTIKWETPSTTTSPYVETLANDTTTLHKALNKFLPAMTVEMIMVPVFKGYKDQLGKAILEVVVETEEGKERLLRDITYLNTRLGSISGFDDMGTYLTKLVNEKAVLRPTPLPAAAEPEIIIPAPTNGAAKEIESESEEEAKINEPPAPSQKDEMKEDTATAIPETKA